MINVTKRYAVFYPYAFYFYVKSGTIYIKKDGSPPGGNPLVKNHQRLMVTLYQANSVLSIPF